LYNSNHNDERRCASRACGLYDTVANGNGGHDVSFPHTASRSGERRRATTVTNGNQGHGTAATKVPMAVVSRFGDHFGG
jgi:hypothetical protein